MARIPESIFNNWFNGNKIHAEDYKKEREILRTAINDNYDRLMEKYDKLDVDSLLDTLKGEGWTGELTLKRHEDLIQGIFLDYYDKVDADSLLEEKADKANTYTKSEVDDSLGLKADKDDVYSKVESDDLLDQKPNREEVYTKEYTYSKNEVDEKATLQTTEFIDGGSFLDKYTSQTAKIDGGVF